MAGATGASQQTALKQYLQQQARGVKTSEWPGNNEQPVSWTTCGTAVNYLPAATETLCFNAGQLKTAFDADADSEPRN